MNLRKILIDVILEFQGRTYYLPEITKDDRTIEFGVSFEQNESRSGNSNPLLPQNRYNLRKIISGQWKSGVYNLWIREVVEKNFNKVFNSVLEMNMNMKNKSRNRAIFVGSNEYIDSMEFVVDFEVYSENKIGLKVITSGISKETENYFANKAGDEEVDLINEIYKKFVRIYLTN